MSNLTSSINLITVSIYFIELIRIYRTFDHNDLFTSSDWLISNLLILDHIISFVWNST